MNIEILGFPVEDVEWHPSSVGSLWPSVFELCLMTQLKQFNHPKWGDVLLERVRQAYEPFLKKSDDEQIIVTHPFLEHLITAVYISQNPQGTLVPNVFKAYIRRKCKSKLGYSEAKKAIQRYHPSMPEDDLKFFFGYLDALKELRTAVRDLYKHLDPYLVINDKPFSKRYQEFKDNYAYETVFGFIQY